VPDARPRVLLADDHLLFVKSLERLLEQEVEVVGTSTDGRALLEAAEEVRPDLVLCDISMPEVDGLEATRRLVARDPEARVVILSMHTDPDHVQAAFRAGARGYVVKHAAPEELLTAVREVLRGHHFVSPGVAGQITRIFREGPQTPPISPREREILTLVARGLGNRRIAESLFISEATVRTHLSHLYSKLGCSNRVELALYAVKAGLGC
jgi:DNA-binding NarL/FixJ family response regulator